MLYNEFASLFGTCICNLGQVVAMPTDWILIAEILELENIEFGSIPVPFV
jgi:hypothetical protein